MTISVRDLVSASCYELMDHNPDHAYVGLSYGVFKRLVMQQWTELREGGITFVASTENPYKNSTEMLNDVLTLQRLVVFADNGATLQEDHPMLERVASGVDGIEVYNDVFRAVHDVMGHVMAGASFGPKGEEAAWRSHKRTLPIAAHNALWCETLGQNRWTNFAHHHAELPLPERPYAEQKSGLVPQYLST